MFIIRSSKTPLPSILSNALLLPPCNGSTSHHIAVGIQFILISMFLPPGVTTSLCTYFGAVYGKYGLVSIKFSFKPEKAMFDFGMAKACL